MSVATVDKTAGRFRDMAARLDAEIAAKRLPRRENTPKQQKEATAQRIEADHLDRVRAAMLALADARESGSLPEVLCQIKSKADLLSMLRTRIDCSGGYYSIRDTCEFYDKSPLAVELRSFVEAQQSPMAKAIAADQFRLNQIAELEADVKFRPIAGFFPTPPAVIERMIELAEIEPGMLCLEPSAGKGDLAEAIVRAGAEVFCVEVNHTLYEILLAKRINATRGDFLQMGGIRAVDRALLNPPFERGQDCDHVQHAYTFLRPGGRLVAVMSRGAFTRQFRKEASFRAWLAQVNGVAEDLPADSFNGAFRSTGVACKLVVIDRE